MIAPVNCNPHCDCAQRLVRCERAAQADKVIDRLVADGIAPLQPGEPIPDTECRVRNPEHVRAAIIKDWEQHQDYELEGLLKVGDLSADLDHQWDGQKWVRLPDPPPMVIPASLAATTYQLPAPQPTPPSLSDRLVAAFRACELDCADWHEDSLRKLAGVAVSTLVKAHVL